MTAKLKPSEYSGLVWDKAKKNFADQQFCEECLGEYNLLSWLKQAQRQLAAKVRKSY